MARYNRGPREVYSLKQPNGKVLRAYKYQEIRYVSKPLRSEVCPHKVYWADRKLLSAGDLLSDPYVYTDCRTISPYSWLKNRTGVVGTLHAEALNKAYARFLDKVNSGLETSQWAVGLAERRQAMSMVRTRTVRSVETIAHSAMTMAAAYRSLRRGDFGRFLSLLKLKRLPKRLQRRIETPRGRWSSPERASALWLEYWFGWSPLVADIHSAVSILEAELPEPAKFYASAKAIQVFDRTKIGYDSYLTGTINYRVRIGAEVVVSNPNLRRATLLGLTNPATVAWELIPFSFLVDWFIPVSQFLNSWSDFYGLTVKNSYTATLGTFTGVENYQWAYAGGRYHTDTFDVAGVHTRDVGIATPIVYPKVFKGLSVTRGATAVSLLLQVLKPSKIS